ncbi:phage tail protein [Brassicibacter mesophilus]|uniref:phage tail protein n=1 Tax=Brassicibacter mesophilus TaxID=745119 RepID=UPI003D1A7DDC
MAKNKKRSNKKKQQPEKITQITQITQIEQIKQVEQIVQVVQQPDKGGQESKNKAEGGILKDIGKVAQTASNFGKMVADVVVSVGSSVLDLANKASAMSLELEKISNMTGLSTTQLQELQFTASQTGVEFSTIQSAAIAMNESMNNTEAFETLGINLKNAEGNLKTTDEVFNEAIMKLANMADETERNALATELFGSNATQLTPLLEQGSEGIQQYKDQARELGIVMSEEAINSNVEFSKTMDAIKQAGNAILTQIGTALIPILQEFFDWVLENMPFIQEVLKIAFEFMSESVGFFIGLIQELIAWVQVWAVSNEETLNNIKELFASWFEAIKSGVELFIETVKALWQKYGDDITAIFRAAWDLINSILDTSIKIFKDIFNIFASLFKGDWEGLWNGIKQLFSDIWQGINDILDKYVEYLKTTIKLGLTVVNDIFESIWNGIKKFVEGIWDSIVGNIKDSINFILKSINKFIGGLNNIKIKVPTIEIPFVGTVGGFTIGLPKIPSIPLLADGGMIISSGMAIVGEKGPELIELPTGARVYSNEETRSMLGRGGITQNITINSPTPLSPSIIKRKTLEASRLLALEWGV